MLQFSRAEDTDAQRKQLLYLGFALLAASAAMWFLLSVVAVPGVLFAVGLMVLLVATVLRRAVPDVYLATVLLSFLIGRVVSYLIVGLVYIFGIFMVGLIARAFGVDRLRRNFENCRRRSTMFEDAPDTDLDSFERQS